MRGDRERCADRSLATARHQSPLPSKSLRKTPFLSFPLPVFLLPVRALPNRNLMNLLEMPAEIQQITKGLIILAAAAIQRRDR